MLAWFGGGYMPLEVLGPSLSRVGAADPVYWINQAILGVIYRSDYTMVAPAIGINLGVAALFLIVAALFARREAA